jgi:hypothetical protein
MMKTLDTARQGIDAADEAYAGSRFSEIRNALFANPYQPVWSASGVSAMPRYEVTLASVLAGILPFGRPFGFLGAARRTVRSRADLRWGPDGKGARRLLHPNGICLFGRWDVTEHNPYSGYFRPGSSGLVIARYSTCCNRTTPEGPRSLSLVGKLFPTLDEEHTQPVKPAHFITQQDLGGETTSAINDAELRNAPDTRAWRRGSGLGVLLVTGATFPLADRQPAIRQLYEIAELEKPGGTSTVAPAFLRFRVADSQPIRAGPDTDFRDEIMSHIYDAGDPVPRRTLVFDIEVTDTGSVRGPALYQRHSFSDWRRIGKLTFDRAIASYNGDFVVHFHHPPWRDDRNDPATQHIKNRT